MHRRQIDLPPFNLDGSFTVDERTNWISNEEAAEFFGLGRTQTWRWGKKWEAMMKRNITPPVLVKVFSQGDRLEYKFERDAAIRWGRERRAAKALRRAKRADQLAAKAVRQMDHADRLAAEIIAFCDLLSPGALE